MTYPGQPPHGGQQPGGYPYGYQQPWGQPPPKKSRTALIAGLTAGFVVVGLVAFLITGLVAPAFLLADEDERKPVPSPTSSSPPVPTTGPGSPQGFVDDLLTTVKKGDRTALLEMYCEPPDEHEKEEIGVLTKGKADLRLADEIEPGDTHLMEDLTGTVYGKKIKEGYLVVIVQDGEPCFDTIQVDLREVTARDGLPTARKIVSRFNAGKSAEVVRRMCNEASRVDAEQIREAIKDKARIKIAKSTTGLGDDAEYALSGSVAGKPLSSEYSELRLKSETGGASWCIDRLYLAEKN